MNNKEIAQQSLAKAHAHIKDGIADTMDIYGVNRSIGQLYATLYLHNGPMTLDQLRDELGMSKGSMSLGVRKLLEEKLIHRVYRKGERKDLYEAEKDFFHFFTTFFTRRWERERAVNVEAIHAAIPEYEALMTDSNTPLDVQQEAERTLKTITASLAYYEFLDLLVEQFRHGQLAEELLSRFSKKGI
ncbi:MarR family transcriptional regulator [Bacillus sp. FSL W7-1360]